MEVGETFQAVFLCLHLLQFYCHIVCLAGLRGATICQSYSCPINTPGNMMSKHLEMFGTFPILFNLVFAQEVKEEQQEEALPFFGLFTQYWCSSTVMQSTAWSKRSGRPRFSTMRPGFHDNLVP